MPRQTISTDLAAVMDCMQTQQSNPERIASLEAVLAAEGVAACAPILEVGCGGGQLLAALRGERPVYGMERAQTLADLARRRLGTGVVLEQDDLLSLTTPAPVGAVMCMRGAVGVWLDERTLTAGLRAIWNVLTPGGVLVIEPGVSPEHIRAGQAQMTVCDGVGVKIVRSAVVRIVGRKLHRDDHWMVGRAHQGVAVMKHRHTQTMLTDVQLEHALTAAGFVVHHRELPPGGRGLWIGLRSE